MALLNPKVSSILAIIAVSVYIALHSILIDVTTDLNFIFMILIGGLIGIAAFTFAAEEVKDTEGLHYTLDISLGKLVGIFLFSFFIAIGYDALVLVIIEIILRQQGEANLTLNISTSFMAIIIAFLIIFPLIQFYYLARPGEDSSIPAEFPIERVMEKVANVMRSPLVAAVFAYGLLYALPIVLLTFLPNVNIYTSILLWALVLPLISLGALAGAGFGEDLIRLKLVRNLKDLPKLGLPQLKIRQLSFDFGGLFLVLFAIQALLLTTYYGLQGIAVSLSLTQLNGGIFISVVFTLFLTLFNKGRGAFKELKEVWTESGFKVSVFQLFLPVFVFLGVILSSALEVFVQNSNKASGVLFDLGLKEHIGLASFFLAVQNFVLIGTAIYIFNTTPATVERRLIKEVPEFYGEDLDGYSYIYGKLQHVDSIENLITELTKRVNDHPDEIEFLKKILEETIEIDSNKVKIAIAEATHMIASRESKYDKRTYELTKQLLETDVVGAQIYAVRTMKSLIRYLDGIEKEESLTYLQSFVAHPDSVVSWETSLILFRILKEDPQYRSFILAKMITTLSTDKNQNTIDSITRFFRKIADESYEIGQMAVSTLGIRLVSGQDGNTENLVLGIKALLRGNPQLTQDLIDQISIGTDDPDENVRVNSYKVLVDMAQYGSDTEKIGLELILKGIDDSADVVKMVAYQALAQEINKRPEVIDMVYGIINAKYNQLNDRELGAALTVIDEIISMEKIEYGDQIYQNIATSISSDNDQIREQSLRLLGDLAQWNRSYAEPIYRMAESNLSNQHERVRQAAVICMGKLVLGDKNLANSIYRQLSECRDDGSYIVQLAAVEALGNVASVSDELADKIYQSLLPLLEDTDWQVRLAALNGIFAATKVRPTLAPQLVKASIKMMKDSNRNIRLQALDLNLWIIDNYRPGAEQIMNDIDRTITQSNDDEFATTVNTMEIIAEEYLLLVPRVLKNIQPAFTRDNNNLRFAALKALEAALGKLKQARNIQPETRSQLNQLMSVLMKAANQSNTKIRKDAYIGITEISAALPELKIADRGRLALRKATKLEKDIALLEYLDEANIRAKKPLDIEFGAKHL